MTVSLGKPLEGPPGVALEKVVAAPPPGEGADIHFCMFDVIAEWLTVPLPHQEAGKPPRRIGLAQPSIAPHGVFATEDGNQSLILVQSNRGWTKLCSDVLGDISYATNQRFATNIAHVQNRSTTDALVRDAFAWKKHDAAIELLSNADIAFASLNDMAALSVNPHLRPIALETAEGAVNRPAPAPAEPL